MYSANRIKEQSIFQYLLYMWQVEDVIRAYSFDIDAIEANRINQQTSDPDQRRELREWYEGIIQMMHEEGIETQGHMQVNRSIVIMLTDLHLQLLKSPKHPVYSALYYKVLPYIVELRRKSDNPDKPEIETCLEAMYGLLILAMQRKEVSAQTRTACDDIGKLLEMLSEYYKQDKKQELDL